MVVASQVKGGGECRYSPHDRGIGFFLVIPEVRQKTVREPLVKEYHHSPELEVAVVILMEMRSRLGSVEVVRETHLVWANFSAC